MGPAVSLRRTVLDKSGVAPLHRAVRDRCSGGVSALIDKGADPLLMNKSGSTPLHLAVQNTGKSHSGSDAAKEEQHRIIVLLLEHGASPNDLDTMARPLQPPHRATGSVNFSTATESDVDEERSGKCRYAGTGPCPAETLHRRSPAYSGNQ